MINENKIINNKIMLKMSEFFMTTTGYVETKEKWKYDNYSLICVLKKSLMSCLSVSCIVIYSFVV